MKCFNKFVLTSALSLSVAGAALADAYATGEAAVTEGLYNVGFNGFGGTGNQISISLFSNFNTPFYVSGNGPGSGSLFYGGGLLDGGYDAGSGADWSLYGEDDSSGNSSNNFGFSDAGLLGPSGSTNFATEDTFDEMV